MTNPDDNGQDEVAAVLVQVSAELCPHCLGTAHVFIHGEDKAHDCIFCFGTGRMLEAVKLPLEQAKIAMLHERPPIVVIELDPKTLAPRVAKIEVP